MKINKELKEKIKNISDMNAEELENFKFQSILLQTYKILY